MESVIDLPDGSSTRRYEGYRPNNGGSIGQAATLGAIRSKIDEDFIKQQAAQVKLRVVKIKISDAVPIEKGYIEQVLKDYMAKYAAGAEVSLPEAIEIGGEYLIVEGVNRVGAQKEIGWTEAEVILVPDKNPIAHRQVLAERKAEGRKGFNCMVTFRDAAERRDAGV